MRKLLILLGGAIIVGLLIGFGFFLRDSSKQNYKGISGMIDLNGVAPTGSTITLSQRKAYTTDSFVTFTDNIPAQDGTLWQFSKAKEGQSYEIQATVLQDGKVIVQSSPISVTSPAINEQLRLNVASSDLEQAAVPTPTVSQAVISGTIGVNGYIPAGSTITVQGRVAGVGQYTTVASNLNAVDNQQMTYTTATAGQTYEVIGIIYNSSGQAIGQSGVLTVTAPASNELLSINSTAQPPATPTPTPQPAATQAPQPTATPVPSGAISGSINFNGQAPSNSRIVVFQRVTGSSQFILAQDNISPVNGMTWRWSNAVSGVTYDVIAILKQRQSNGTDQDISSSNIITAAAPASNEVFNINSGFALPAASGNITVACNNYDSGSQQWQATVSYQSITNAQSYWFQIGTNNGGIQLTNSTFNATNNPTQSYTYQFQNNTTYYARYAYSNVSNLQANSSQFSAFSSTQQLHCSQ